MTEKTVLPDFYTTRKIVIEKIKIMNKFLIS